MLNAKSIVQLEARINSIIIMKRKRAKEQDMLHPSAKLPKVIRITD